MLVSFEQSFPCDCFACSCRADNEDRMSDIEEFIQLDNFCSVLFLRLQFHVTGCSLNRLLQIWISFPWHIKIRKEIRDEAQEDRTIFSHYFGQVEVSECSHKDLGLGSLQITSLERSSNHQDRLDGPQAPVIVILLGQQLLTEFVEGYEFGG